jgi:hypothetical protein
LEEELNNDIDSDELELLSDDEIQIDTSHLLDGDHAKISSQNREEIEEKMKFIFQSFKSISSSMGSNL